MAKDDSKDVAGKTSHIEVASVKHTDPHDVKTLLETIEGLQLQLKESEEKRSAVEQAALEAAEAQGQLLQREISEVPTGKLVTVQKIKKYKVVDHKNDGRPIYSPIFQDVEIPSFFYKVDLPPSGGTHLMINGIPYHHGTVIEVDLDTLRTVKDMVHRSWRHEIEIKGSDENAFRKTPDWRARNQGIMQ